MRCARMLGLLLCSVGLFANAAELQPKTLRAWEDYVRTADAEMEKRLAPGGHFLWLDENPGRLAKVRSGEIVVAPAGPHIPKRVPGGLVHDWIGAAFIPRTTIRGVLGIVRDYVRYSDFYRPTVLDSKTIAHGDMDDRFSMLLMNKALFLKTALEGDYETTYFQVDHRRYYSIAHATRLREIEGYGGPGEHELSEDEGSGLIWRLSSITRFEERDGGVYVELEALALSRDIPVSLRWLVDPIVRRVSRDSVITSLRQTGNAVHNAGTAISAERRAPVR